MTRFPLIALLLLLPGMPMAQTETEQEVVDSCGAAGFAGLIGQSGEVARLLVLETMVRVIAPGDAVTRDFRLDRINFDVDEEDVIERIWCG